MAGIVAWGEEHFKTIGSGRSSTFDCSLTPWLREPIERGNDGATRECDLVKPIQTGGTSLGELLLLYWLTHWFRGDISYYWPTDAAAETRWLKHFDRKLKACAAVMALLQLDRFKSQKCLVALPAINFIMQGALTDRSVASDSFRGIVCEECHDTSGWEEGRLEQAFGRLTGYWDSIGYVISNAGLIGGELHKRFMDGTRQFWEVECPGCKRFHSMHARKREDGSGLLYDMAGQPEHSEPNYRKLAPTIRYRFECGYEMRDNLADRRRLSATGRYSEPTNPDAPLTHRSYTYEATSCHDIAWLDLIKQKQAAWAARRRGDPGLWNVYRRERECEFVPAIDRPEAKAIVLSSGVTKNRVGLVDRMFRFATADYQKGRENETPHFWMVIRDWRADGSSLLVWEGKCVDQGELVGTITDHKVDPLCVCIDSSFDPREVIYPLCLNRGYCCIKVEGETAGAPKVYKHHDSSLHIYSEWQYLATVAGTVETHDLAHAARFWHVSKWGMQEALAWLRASQTPWGVPEDVSPEYKAHMEAWTYSTRRAATTNQLLPTWKQLSDEDHMYQCEGYQIVCAQMEKIIGVAALPEKPEPKA